MRHNLRPKGKFLYNKPVDELVRALLSFKRPTRPHRTATVPIICNFHIQSVNQFIRVASDNDLFIYLRTQHSKQYKIEDTIKAAKF